MPFVWSYDRRVESPLAGRYAGPREGRRDLVAGASGAELDANVSREWFDCCTERLERMWLVQRFLVDELLERCQARILVAKARLEEVRLRRDLIFRLTKKCALLNIATRPARKALPDGSGQGHQLQCHYNEQQTDNHQRQ